MLVNFPASSVGARPCLDSSYGVNVRIDILLRAFKLARRQSFSSLLDPKVCIGSFYNYSTISSLIVFVFVTSGNDKIGYMD